MHNLIRIVYKNECINIFLIYERHLLEKEKSEHALQFFISEYKKHRFRYSTVEILM